MAALNVIPRVFLRGICFALPTVLALVLGVEPAMAQSGDLIRDTEIERLMRSYEDPILKVAGIDPASIKMYLLDDPTINAAATISPDPTEGEIIVVNAGT